MKGFEEADISIGAGYPTDQVLATAVLPNGNTNWEQLIGVLPTISQVNTAKEILINIAIDCDGTTGNIWRDDYNNGLGGLIVCINE